MNSPLCVMAPEQLHVMSSPPGRTTAIASLLSCRYLQGMSGQYRDRALPEHPHTVTKLDSACCLSGALWHHATSLGCITGASDHQALKPRYPISHDTHLLAARLRPLRLGASLGGSSTMTSHWRPSSAACATSKALSKARFGSLFLC